jgi:hypothetical protein
MGAGDCLFAEMDQMADEFCASSTFVACQIEFRQLQKVHFPDVACGVTSNCERRRRPQAPGSRMRRGGSSGWPRQDRALRRLQIPRQLLFPGWS